MKRTLKVKLVPLSRKDKRELLSLLEEYTRMLREMQQIVNEKRIKSRRRAHEELYEPFRKKFPHLHNKFVQEAYKRCVQNYASYDKLRRKWERKLRKLGFKEPAKPEIGRNRVVDLHVDTFEIDGEILTVKKGNGVRVRLLLLEYRWFVKQMTNARIQNSKLLVGKEMYLLLTVKKHIDVKDCKNELYVDLNENNVSCLLLDRENLKAHLFSIEHDISKIKQNYRLRRKSIQRKVESVRKRNQLLRKYGRRERNRVKDRIRKMALEIARIGEMYNANLVLEKLKGLRESSSGRRKRRSRKLNFRLNSIPYRLEREWLIRKFEEKGLDYDEINAENSSIECPICHHVSKRNRVKDVFRCGKCGFTFNVHFVACLNLALRRNEGRVTRPGGGLLAYEEAPVVSSDDALHDPSTQDERGEREARAPIPIEVVEVSKLLEV